MAAWQQLLLLPGQHQGAPGELVLRPLLVEEQPLVLDGVLLELVRSDPLRDQDGADGDGDAQQDQENDGQHRQDDDGRDVALPGVAVEQQHKDAEEQRGHGAGRDLNA